MKLSRYYEPLPTYAYCQQLGCQWTDSGSAKSAAVDDEAGGHVHATGHTVRVVTRSQVLLSPAVLQAVPR